MCKQFKVGEEVLFNGEKVRVIARVQGKAVVYNMDRVQSAAQVVNDYKLQEIELLARDVFSIGDDVYTNYTFEGKVTAFEDGGRLAICKSHHETDRRRYAYTAREISLGFRKGCR